MGLEGAKYLATSLAEMKILSKLILNDNDIGDHGVAEILNSARNYCSIEILDLSGNNLGKSPASGELAESMYQFLSNNRTMEVLKVNWNSLRGNVADKIMEGLLECTGIREVHLNNNLLGVTYEDKQPPVNRLAEILQTLKHLEQLDISFNIIDQKSIFCLAHGLKLTTSLLNLNVEGNPIGP